MVFSLMLVAHVAFGLYCLEQCMEDKTNNNMNEAQFEAAHRECLGWCIDHIEPLEYDGYGMRSVSDATVESRLERIIEALGNERSIKRGARAGCGADDWDVDGTCCPASRTQWDESYENPVKCCHTEIVKKDGTCCGEDEWAADGVCCPASRTQWDGSFTKAEKCCETDIVKMDGTCSLVCGEDEFEVDGACCPVSKVQWDSSFINAEKCCDADIVRFDGKCCPPIAKDGRCGPLFGGAMCSTKWKAWALYCNEENGWCGNTDAHKNAQASTAYDESSIPAECPVVSWSGIAYGKCATELGPKFSDKNDAKEACANNPDCGALQRVRMVPNQCKHGKNSDDADCQVYALCSGSGKEDRQDYYFLTKE